MIQVIPATEESTPRAACAVAVLPTLDRVVLTLEGKGAVGLDYQQGVELAMQLTEALEILRAARRPLPVGPVQ